MIGPFNMQILRRVQAILSGRFTLNTMPSSCAGVVSAQPNESTIAASPATRISLERGVIGPMAFSFKACWQWAELASRRRNPDKIRVPIWRRSLHWQTARWRRQQRSCFGPESDAPARAVPYAPDSSRSRTKRSSCRASTRCDRRSR